MKYDKYNYEKMSALDWTQSMTALAKEVGCSRQHFYKLKEKFVDDKRIKDMEIELKKCKAKLKALSQPK